MLRRFNPECCRFFSANRNFLICSPLYYCYFRQFSGPTHRSADSANRREIRSKSVKDLGSHTLTNIVNITSIRGRVNISFIKISVCLLPLPCVLN